MDPDLFLFLPHFANLNFQVSRGLNILRHRKVDLVGIVFHSIPANHIDIALNIISATTRLYLHVILGFALISVDLYFRLFSYIGGICHG